MGTSPKSPCDVRGGPVFNVAGGDASEFSLLLRNLACADFVADFGNWEEGGGVIVLVARTGEPSLGSSLTSVGPPGLERGVASPRRIAVSGIGVRGEVISDMSIYVARTHKYVNMSLRTSVRGCLMQRIGTGCMNPP